MNRTQLAIDAAGGTAQLARLVGVSYQTIQKWHMRERVPHLRVLQIERLTGVSRHDLRPDLYPLNEMA